MTPREIKFRAWDGNKMYLPEGCDQQDYFITPEGEIRYIHEVGVVGHKTDSYRKGWTLMQYTGLKDCKGNEVYEGDIISLEGKHYFEVRFENGKFGCYYLSNDLGRWGDLCRFSEHDFKDYRHEVVGNIYTHQHLIPLMQFENK